MSKYLKNGMKLVYLDHCILNYLYKGNLGFYETIRELLEHGNAKRKLMVPLSLEHYYEISPGWVPNIKERMEDINALLNTLSFGWWIQSETQLAANQMFRLVRGGRAVKIDFLEKSRIAFDPQVMASQKEALEANAFGVLAENHQSVLDVFVENRASGKVAEYVDAYTRHPNAAFLKTIDAILGTGKIVAEASSIHPEQACFESRVLYVLATEKRFSLEDFKILRDEIADHGNSRIPILEIRAAIKAHDMFTRRKLQKGDIADNTRISKALPVADVLVCDHAKARAIRETGLDRKFGTQIISSKERNELYDTLETLCR